MEAPLTVQLHSAAEDGVVKITSLEWFTFIAHLRFLKTHGISLRSRPDHWPGHT